MGEWKNKWKRKVQNDPRFSNLDTAVNNGSIHEDEALKKKRFGSKEDKFHLLTLDLRWLHYLTEYIQEVIEYLGVGLRKDDWTEHSDLLPYKW